MYRSVFIGLFLALSVTSVGCGILIPKGCTLIGCDSGLLVELEGAPSDPFTMTATATGGETQTIECSGPEDCYLFFQDFTPAEVTVTYESGEQVVEITFSPEYSRIRPNGEDCPPECINASVSLRLG